MKHRTQFATALTLTALLAVPAASALPHRRAPRHILTMLANARQELNLTEDQSQQIRSIFRTLREQNAPYRDRLAGDRQEIFAILLEDPRNLAAAQSLAEERQSAERAMKANMLTATSKALSVLSPEQRTRLASMIAKRRARR